MTEPTHSDILQRVTAVEHKSDSMQGELTEFKTQSRRYRDENRVKVDAIHKYVIEKNAEDQIKRRFWKIVAMTLAGGAAIAGMVKGFDLRFWK